MVLTVERHSLLNGGTYILHDVVYSYGINVRLENQNMHVKDSFSTYSRNNVKGSNFIFHFIYFCYVHST